MFAVENKFPRMLEDLIGDTYDAHRVRARLLIEVGTNRVDSVPDEDGPDETQAVVSIAEGSDAVIGHQSEAETEEEWPCHNSAPEDTFLAGENLIGYVGVHIHHQSIEGHALTFRDRPTDGTHPGPDLEVL